MEMLCFLFKKKEQTKLSRGNTSSAYYSFEKVFINLDALLLLN